LFLAAFALVFLWPGYQELTRPRFPDLDGWDLNQLERHLQDQGLGLRRVDSERMPSMVPCLLLTRTGKDWGQLERLPKAIPWAGQWQGTVYCEKRPDPEGRTYQAALWGDCGLLAGPYLFFGDREILAEIHQALRAPVRSERERPSPA
jgi:hypothetical protein